MVSQGWSNLCTILLATPLSFGEFTGGKIWTIPFILGWNVLDTTISGDVKVIPGGGEFRTLFSEFWVVWKIQGVFLNWSSPKFSKYRILQGDFFWLVPPKFGSPRSHVNWPRFSLSARDYEGILYLENLGGTSQKSHTVHVNWVIISLSARDCKEICT